MWILLTQGTEPPELHIEPRQQQHNWLLPHISLQQKREGVMYQTSRFYSKHPIIYCQQYGHVFFKGLCRKTILTLSLEVKENPPLLIYLNNLLASNIDNNIRKQLEYQIHFLDTSSSRRNHTTFSYYPIRTNSIYPLSSMQILYHHCFIHAWT